MKRFKNLNTARVLFSLALVLVLALSVDPALAWGKKKKKEKKEEPAQAVNLEKHPSMHVYRGVLHQDYRGDWSLDKVPMSFNRNSRISNTPGSEGGTALIDGREAKVTAANIGGTLIVRRVTMMTTDELLERGAYEVGRGEDRPDQMSPSTPQ